MGMELTEPTSEQCFNKQCINLGDGRTAYACWYPQMGGYVAHALAIRDQGCTDVYVWHDGDFPFSTDHFGVDHNPRKLHHCDGQQFVAFGQFLTWLESEDE